MKTLLTILGLLIGAGQIHAEEVICRYCAEAHAQARLPLGLTLTGRYQYAPVRQVDVLHIKLDVTPDWEAKTVSGTSSITAKPIAKPVSVLRLDAIDLQIKEVRCDGGTVADFVSTRDSLQIAFETPLPVGKEFRVEIDYSAQPNAGLYFRTADMGYPESDAHIWTQGEAHEARHWFPCFDYPNERSSTEIICHVPADMTVLSNGKRMGEQIDASGLKAVRWLQEKPHVNYLMCLVAGHLTKFEKQHRNVPLGFYTQPTLAEHAPNSFVDTPDIMAFFEEEIGMPFPWVKYDQVTIADFTAGGMENTTMTTLTDGTIFSKATENIRSTRSLDAHEMAHQWFGDYVTCKDWSHLWLNEGFATYYTHLYEGHKFGRDAMLYRLHNDATGRILTNDKDTKPIVYKEYTDPMQQFDYRAYPKGAWVLHMLRSQLGEDLYRQCIRTYLEKHGLTSVVSDDLRQVIEEQSGRPMDRFFDQWIYHPRHPDLKITYRWTPQQKLAKVTIRQTQPISDDVLLYQFPTKLRFVVGDQVIDHEILVQEEEEDFYVALPAQPSIVRFDPEYTVLAEVEFDKSNELIAAQVEREDDMMGRLLAVASLAKRKTKASVELLSKRLNEDAFFGVRIAAAKALADHESDEAYEVLRASWKDQSDARVRSEVVGAMLRPFEPGTLETAMLVLETETNPAIQASAVAALAKFHGETTQAKLVELLNVESFQDELALAAISAMGRQNDPYYAAPLLEMMQARGGDMNSRGMSRAVSTLAKLSKGTEMEAECFDYLVSQLDHPKTTVQAAMIGALGSLGDRRASAILDSYAGSSNDRIKQSADRAIKSLNETAPAAPAEVVELRKSLAELRKETEKMRDEFEAFRKQEAADSEGLNDAPSNKDDANKE
ncbi:Aminopeptidase [Rhodopirellula islandica]|uniref:Aminopeptidase N n=1 Tax=Rhodopirellula islandica TaxID=595434 RepID=A0A0J1EMM7_RHOIS|nr:M1 family aminopeptidase [Rhodopirellula islandica]KLU06774.1 Aminopeptidase [Rhodopirellula islandica]